MTDDTRFSDELLNAYVDNELDAEESRRIRDAVQRDQRLRERVEELQAVKALVHGAYVDEAPDTGSPVPIRTRNWSPMGLAASVAAFALGVAVTFGLISYTGGPVSPGPAAPGQVASTGTQQAEAVKVVFHVSRDDPGQLDDILNEAEALLTTTERSGQTASVRIIASGDGLSLFEQGAFPVSARVKEMKRAYPEHVVFNGCGVAYKQLKQRQADGALELLPEVQLVDLGVLELMRRQNQGWSYIRI